MNMKMTWRDRLMLMNMLLFLVIGLAILVRSAQHDAPWPAYAFGTGCLVAGGYRLYMVYKVIRISVSLDNR
jgi:hypothetical protein